MMDDKVRLTAQVEYAIQAMYNGDQIGNVDKFVSPSNFKMSQQDALNWLLKFNDTEQSWEIYLSLLLKSEQMVQYYAANGLYTKVLNSWKSLSQDRQSYYVDIFWSIVTNIESISKMTIATMRRLLLCIVSASMNTASGDYFTNFINKIVELVSSESFSTIGLEMSLLLAEQINEYPQITDRQIEKYNFMVSFSRRMISVLYVLNNSMVEKVREDNVQSFYLFHLCLKSIHAWGSLQLTLGEMFTTYNSLFRQLVAISVSHQYSSYEQCCIPIVACDILESLANNRMHPVELGHVESISYLVEYFISNVEPLNALLQASNVALWPQSLAVGRIINTLFSVEESVFLLQTTSTSVATHKLHRFPFVAEFDKNVSADAGEVSRAYPIGVFWGDLLLQCCYSSNYNLAQMCLGCTMNIMSYELDELHIFFHKFFFSSLLHVMLSKAQWTKSRDGDLEDFLAYREEKSPTIDALIDCATRLRHEFIPNLIDWMKKSQKRINDEYSSWSVLEVVLFTLTVTGNGSLSQLYSADSFEDDATTSNPFIQVEEPFTSLLLAIFSTQVSTLNPTLSVTACKWIASVDTWLSSFHFSESSNDKLRYNNGPPFQFHASAVDESFSWISKKIVFQSCLEFLTFSLTRVRDCSIGGEKYHLDTIEEIMDAAGTVVSSTKLKKIQVKKPFDQEEDFDPDDDDNDNEEEEQEAQHLGSMSIDTVAEAAASCISRLCFDCKEQLGTVEWIQRIQRSFVASRSNGLGISSQVKMLRGLLMLVQYLDIKNQAEGMIFLLHSFITSIESSLQQLRVSPDMTVQNGVASTIALLVTALRSLPFLHDPLPIDDPDEALNSIIANEFFSLWLLIEQNFGVFASSSELLACALSYFRHVIRVFPKHLSNRLPSLCEAIVHIFSSTLSPDSIALTESIIASLPSIMNDDSQLGSRGPRIHKLTYPQVTIDACKRLVHGIVATTSYLGTFLQEDLHAGAKIADQLSSLDIHTLTELFRLSTTSLDVCPFALIDRPTNGIEFESPIFFRLCQLICVGFFTCDLDVIIQAKRFLQSAFHSRNYLGSGGESEDCLIVARILDMFLQKYGSIVVTNLIMLLIDARSVRITNFVLDSLMDFVEEYTDMSVEALVNVLLHESARLRKDLREDISSNIDSESGIKALSKEEILKIGQALHKLAGSDIRKCRICVEDLGRVCRGSVSKELILGFLV
jgi:hypothetical protein